MPPIKRWGPYRELSAADWESVLDALEARGSRMTVGITAGWVARDGRVIPFPRKFPDQAAALRDLAPEEWLHVGLADGARLLDPDRSVRARSMPGGPSPQSVLAQADAVEAALAAKRSPAD